MKAERRREFSPITITLETQEELEGLYQIANNHIAIRKWLQKHADTTPTLTSDHLDILYNNKTFRYGEGLYNVLRKYMDK